MLDALAAREAVAARGVLVVAHPDDETIGAGASLRLMPELLLVHVTDGAPRGLGDAAREGFATAEAYAAAREGELEAALGVAGVRPERVRLGVADQEACRDMAGLAGRVEGVLRGHGARWVMTHAYEGGHPDHDAVAFAVHAAAGRVGIGVFEFAGYHADGGEMVVQRFLPGDGGVVVRLGEEEAGRKGRMLGCFATQRGILRWFDPAVERFRVAPRYAFGAAPHGGALNYERWGWMSGAAWRELACAA